MKQTQNAETNWGWNHNQGELVGETIYPLEDVELREASIVLRDGKIVVEGRGGE